MHIAAEAEIARIGIGHVDLAWAAVEVVKVLESGEGGPSTPRIDVLVVVDRG